MAERSNVISVFKGNADNARFAEDLVGYVVRRNTSVGALEGHQGKRRELSPNFDQNAQRAVEYIEDNIKKFNNDTFREIENANRVSVLVYRRFAFDVSLNCSAERFDDNVFLIFCVCISNMAALFYNRGVLKAPLMAETLIIVVLSKYGTSVSGWDALRRATSNIEIALRENKQTLQSPPSGENAPLTLLEDELIRYESSSSSVVDYLTETEK